MENLPICPECNENYTYEMDGKFICPMCGHEWTKIEEVLEVVKDVNGNILQNGDTVSVIKDLKVKGSSSSIKQGTKVKNIRVVLDANDGHNIHCKIDGFGEMKLKSDFVKKI